MDNSQHTPGPWFVTPADDWRDSDGRWVQYGSYLISAGSDTISAFTTSMNVERV